MNLNYLFLVAPIAAVSGVYFRREISKSIHRFRELQTAVQNTSNDSFLVSGARSVIILTKVVGEMLCKRKKTDVVDYIVNGEEYSLLIRPRKGPMKIVSVVNEKGDDVTSLVLRYAGPAQKFHGERFTPFSFNCEELRCRTVVGDEIVFKGSERINF